MFEKFTSEGSNDFRQRYLNTFGYFEANGKRTLVKLAKIFTDSRDKYVEFVDQDGAEYKVVADAKNDDVGFRFLPPKSSWYNRKDGCPILLTRVATKQYLRGICDKNTNIVNLRGGRVNVDFPALSSIFEEKITPKEVVDHAFAMYRGGILAAGVAISPQFVVGFASETIKCFNHVIGNCIYDGKKFNVKLLDAKGWPEVDEAFKRAGLEAEVK